MDVAEGCNGGGKSTCSGGLVMMMMMPLGGDSMMQVVAVAVKRINRLIRVSNEKLITPFYRVK